MVSYTILLGETDDNIGKKLLVPKHFPMFQNTSLTAFVLLKMSFEIY